MPHTPFGYRIEAGKAIVDEEKANLIVKVCEQIEEERLRRLKKLGRDKRTNKQEEVVVCTSFHLPRITTKYDDPVKQAEYAYSLIEREEG